MVVFVHATGFCKEVCQPVIDEVRRRTPGFRALAIDQRAHGDSTVPAVPFDWWDIGRDVVELVGDSRPAIGVGHSAGGAALVLAELARPGTFSALVLAEPIIFPPPYGRFPDNPMAEAARRRKRFFADRDAAYSNFESKAAFAGWEPRALQAYVDGGFRDHEGGVVLKCSPESEAEFFSVAMMHRAWDRLGEVEVPVLVVAGADSTTHQEPFLTELTAQMPHAEYKTVPDASHFVFMERPGAIAEYIARRIRAS